MTVRPARAWQAPLNATAWLPVVAGDARLDVSSAAVGRRPALRLDFDFEGQKGFVVARCPLQHRLSDDYTVSLRLRGAGPAHDLEIKLVDASGQNVWRHVEANVQPSARWRRLRLDSRAFDFAWGPASADVPRDLGAIELAIVAREAGAGTLWLADLEIADHAPPPHARARASSARPGYGANEALRGSAWMPRADDARPWLAVDFVETRTLGGLVIDWREGAPAGGFRVRASSGGRRWRTVYAAARAGGARSYVYLPGLKARLLRLEFDAPFAGAGVDLQPFAFSRSLEAFWYAIARREPRAWYPRWLHREQTLWTPIGTANGTHCALMNEEGAVEIAPASFSIEPMVMIDGALFGWADAEQRQELLEATLPVPSSLWETMTWRLRVEAEATEHGNVRIRYRLENRSDRSVSARLLVLVRPLQVTPPWQSVGAIGGVSPIHDIAWESGALRVNDAAAIVPASAPSHVAAATFDEGFVALRLREIAGEHAERRVHDPRGLASAALGFDLNLGSRTSAERIVECALANSPSAFGEPAFDWAKELPATQWSGPGWAVDVIRTALTATGHILATRSGPALQPGPRRYTRSWIRDGAIMSAALLRMQHRKEVVEFLGWYAPHQRADGFVPCCVDRAGADWLVEHDSHGELIVAIADCYRFTGGASFLEASWPFVAKAVACIEALLDESGLLPVSASHEGYLAQPVHAYWDDFWALRGLRDAVDLAQALGDGDAAARWRATADRLAAALFESIERTRAAYELDFIPGSVEWADFDPTATAIAIAFLDVADGLDRRAVERTFDRYLVDWRRKRCGALEWDKYSPYEIRIVGALVRLGRREAAIELLRFFLSDRRPPAWNQWPEIAWRDRRAPAHVGDLPHTWVAAEYVLAVRSLFAYERSADCSLVVAAGLAAEWMLGPGVEVHAMPTLHGPLSFSARALDEHTLRCAIGAGVNAGIELRPPLSGPLIGVTLDGKPHAAFDAQSVLVPHTPAEIVCRVSVPQR